MSTNWPDPLATADNGQDPIRIVKQGEHWTVEKSEEQVVDNGKAITPNFISKVKGSSHQHVSFAPPSVRYEALPSEEVVDDRYVQIETELQKQAWARAKTAVESSHAAPARDEQSGESDRNDRSSLGLADQTSHAGTAEAAL